MVQLAACSLANHARHLQEATEPSLTVAQLRAAALASQAPCPSSAPAQPASSRRQTQAAEATAARGADQYLPRLQLTSTLLYSLALALLQGGHAGAARPVLVAIAPTHCRLPVYWLRFGEACMHAAEAAHAAPRHVPEARHDADSGTGLALEDPALALLALSCPMLGTSLAGGEAAGAPAEGLAGIADHPAGQELDRPTPEQLFSEAEAAFGNGLLLANEERQVASHSSKSR
jgi:hypothetical protein